MAHFDCDLCPLGSLGTRAVTGEGPVDAKIMIVGMNPGYNEARIGRPFVGRSGQLLDKILKAAGIERSEVYVTNTVKHRTPENRAPLKEEIAMCKVYLDIEYTTVQPKVVILMGASAQQQVFKTTPTKANGLWRFVDGRATVGAFHPAYLLRSPHDVASVIKAFQEVREYVLALANTDNSE